MYVKKEAASVEQLLEYVGPCVEEVPMQPDWENVGPRRVDDLIACIGKLLADADGPTEELRPLGCRLEKPVDFCFLRSCAIGVGCPADSNDAFRCRRDK